VLTIYSTIIGTTNNSTKYLRIPYHRPPCSRRTSVLDLDRDMKESEEYEEINMFHNNKNIVKGHINFNFKENNGEMYVPRPMLRDGCNQDEFRSFTLQWRLYVGVKVRWMIGSSDDSC
jgi:hypothetical protein